MSEHVANALTQLNRVILGKEEEVKLAVSCLISGGHLLIEDLPGMGKTTLAHALSLVFGLLYRRVQFTSDLLPSDVLGVSVYERDPVSGNGQFRFQPGPVFTQVLLADEINRATAKSQSALLEAMEEYQVTVEGETRPLPEPFFVIATQNPMSQSGTFNLPESQLDRFMMRLHLGYPTPKAERALFEGDNQRHMLAKIVPAMTVSQLKVLRQRVGQVKASPAILDYLQRILAFTREDGGFAYGLSPRGGLSLLRAARSWALVNGRDYLLPEDIQQVLATVVNHRLGDSHHASAADHILNRVQVLA